jgi:hypothetical protein
VVAENWALPNSQSKKKIKCNLGRNSFFLFCLK